MIIRVINPTISSQWNGDTQTAYETAAHPESEISVVSLTWGTASIESYRDEFLAVPDILNKVVEAEQDGSDAVIIDCMSDPGLFPARELVRIPVVGPAQASMHLAAVLGHRFSFLTVFEPDIPAVEDLASRYGLGGKLASARPFNIPVLDLHKDLEATVQVLVDLSSRGLEGDVAEKTLESVGIILNRNVVPGDAESPGRTSGIRLGSAAISAREMGKGEVARIADLMDTALTHHDKRDELRQVAAGVSNLCKKFPFYK